MSTILVSPAPVTRRGSVGAYVVLELAVPEVASIIQPGQFVNVAVDCGLLRRPFSVYQADRARGTLQIAFHPIGEGTRWLATRAPGDVLDVVGPLGSGFVPVEGRSLLIGGGYGTAALSFLAREIDGAVITIAGARTADRLFIDDVLREVSIEVDVMTDDGSAGKRGLVIEAMPRLLREGVTVYACGPNPMLQAVGRMASAAGLQSQLAVEEFMACGLGVCWTCVVPVKANGDIKHARVCTEGPVFSGEAMAWT